MKQQVNITMDIDLLYFTDNYVRTHKTTRTQLITDLLVKLKESVDYERK